MTRRTRHPVIRFDLSRFGRVRALPRWLAKGPVLFYRYAISPLWGPSCRYHPSCSAYALEALERHGAAKGVFLALGRVARCHPYARRGFSDPVPERFAWRDVIRYKRKASTE